MSIRQRRRRVTGLMKLLLCAAMLSLLTACSPLAVLNAFVPGSTYRLHAGQAYGAHERHVLDVYVPAATADGDSRPVVVFFYGGAWQSGRRQDYAFAAEALASRGFVVVVPDYRVHPEVRYPAFVEDGALAVAWTARHIGRLGGDPSSIFLMGHSAGAHIATMLAYNDRFLPAQGVSGRAVRGVIGLAGPYDFVPTEPVVREILSADGGFANAMPARHVNGGEPPSLLITGGKDTRVSPGNQERLAARLRGAGSRVEALSYAELNHSTVIARLARPIRDERILDAIAAFVRRHAPAR